MVDPVTVLKRADGAWVVILAADPSRPMEFVCESEEQARAFAHNLTRPDRVRPRGVPVRRAGWLQRILRTG